MRRRAAPLLLLATVLGACSDPGPGRPDVAVPLLIGAKLDEASAILQGLGLCVLVEEGDGTENLGDLIERHPRRYVVDQLPGAGTPVPERTLVRLRMDTEHDLHRVLYRIARTNRAMTCPAGSGIGAT